MLALSLSFLRLLSVLALVPAFVETLEIAALGILPSWRGDFKVGLCSGLGRSSIQFPVSFQF